MRWMYPMCRGASAQSLSSVQASSMCSRRWWYALLGTKDTSVISGEAGSPSSLNVRRPAADGEETGELSGLAVGLCTTTASG